MRRFILKSLVLALFFTIVLGAFNFFIGLKLLRSIDYGGAQEIQYCVLGHSHPECAFNDSLIDGMKNFALSGEAYFYNYYKVKSMLLHGVKLNNVFIEYSNNSLSTDVCEWIWDDQNLSRSYVKFSPFMDLRDNAFIFAHNPSGWLNSYCLSMKWRMDQLFKSRVNYLDYSGGYKYLDRSDMDSLLRTSDGNQNRMENTTMEVCDMNIFYLKELIQLLESNHSKVFLIRSPLHKVYPGFKYEPAYDSIYQQHFSHVERLDFSRFPLNDDDFGDLEHLNYKGAKKFSLAFNDMLSNGLLSSSVKQNFIDAYIESMQ